MTEQHEDVPFRNYEYEYGGVPGTPDWTADRAAFRVVSACPACRVETTRTVRRGIPTGNKGFFRRDRSAEPAPPDGVTVICACGYQHADRPPDSPETGCGAVWKVPLT